MQGTTDELLQQREQYPFGKPRPYSPDHPDLLADGLPPRSPPPTPLCSGRSRAVLVCVAVLATGYGCHGVMTGSLYLPEEGGPGTHYHGVAALLLFGMILSFSACLVTVALARVDAVRGRLTSQRLLSVLFGSGIVFMLAGMTVDAVTR